ncbi:hypothetical protein GGR52DRAFT_270993 [Hypoxylon sp. FL1284]|nr:hypothetical protein GGR52DRAFT_270993 [Hypoxylon sp. FL1284]
MLLLLLRMIPFLLWLHSLLLYLSGLRTSAWVLGVARSLRPGPIMVPRAIDPFLVVKPVLPSAQSITLRSI